MTLRFHSVLRTWGDNNLIDFHFRAAFAIREEVGVVFSSGWGAWCHGGNDNLFLDKISS